MIWQITLSGVAIAFCGVASAVALAQLARQRPFTEKPVLALSACSVTAIIFLLALRGLQYGKIPVFGRLEALSLYSIALFISYMNMAARNNLKGVSAIVLPLITLVMAIALPAINDVPIAPDAAWPTLLLSLHVSTAFIGYGFFTTASILALIYLIQDNNLKRKRFGATYENFPSLENLDSLMRRQIGLAFITFTASIAFGVVMAHRTADVAKWIMDPKAAATAATWIVYAILLHLRTKGDQHGRKIALATIAGLLFVLFTFFGVHIVTESSHSFIITPTGN
jgi:ABC-type transport system involved in cytochrome c biogenesis permease subunit